MSVEHTGIASFVMRFAQHIWEDQGEPHVQWRGKIRHVQGDEEIVFTDLTEALQFIQNHLTQLTINATSGKSPAERDKFLQESFKLWEHFAVTYSNMMFDAMERTFKQSEAARMQMGAAFEKAFQAWQLPQGERKPNTEDEIIEVIDQLGGQVKALEEKVVMLEEKLSRG